MNYSYALNLFISSLTVILITVIAFRRRSVSGGGSLAVLGVAMTLWTMAYGFYWMFSDPHARQIWFNIMLIGVVVVPVTFLVFSLRYTNHSQLVRTPIIAAMSIVPMVTLILVWTDPLHGLFYGGGTPETLVSTGGLAFWVNLVYSYLLVSFGLILLILTWFSTMPLLRPQLSVMLMGAISPILLNIATMVGFFPLPGLDLTAFGFVISCVCIAIALTRFRLLDLIPIARSVIIDQMTDGFFVLDTQDRIVYINRMAEEVIGKASTKVVGQSIQSVLEGFPRSNENTRESIHFEQEFTPTTDTPRFFDLHVTPINDSKNNLNGRLIVARDVTDRKKAERAEHEQRILAEALRDSSAALNQSRTFEEVLDRILDTVGRVVPYDLATILLTDDEHTAHLAGERGYREKGLVEKLHQIRYSYDELPVLKRMIQGGSSLVIPDTYNNPDWKVFEGLEGLRSYVSTPIHVREIVVGFLELFSFSPGFFNQLHADRLQAFANQAAIAIENARLLEDAQERTEELSALLDIGVAVTSGLEMDKILQSLLDMCKRILPIEAFYVATYDEQSDTIEYPLFYDEGESIVVEANKLSDSPGVTGYIIRTRQLLYISDALSEEAIKQFNIVHIDGNPTRSYVGVPLLVSDRVVGVISMQCTAPDAYSPDQIRLLETIATQAAGAIENARLFEAVRLHAEEMTALFDIGITITSGLDMEQVLKTLLEKCRQVLPVEAFYTAILEPNSDMISHPLAYDMGEYLKIPPHDIRKNPGLSGHIINTRKTLYIPDLASPDAIKTYQIFRTSGTPPRAYVGVPMIVGDRMVGIISMQSYQPNAYDASQIRLLETIATQAAVAIENSRLYANAQQEIQEREKAERRYRALFAQSHDAVFIIGFDGKYLEANQRAAEMLGYSVEEICSLYVNDISAEPEESDAVLARLMQGEQVPLFERKYRKKDGGQIITEINVELVHDISGKPLHIQSVVRDISERKSNEMELHNANEKLRLQLSEIEILQTQLREQAIRDPLTGLFNRRYLEETLDREFFQAKRHGTTVCLVMMDIDEFKEFNDTYGHDAGDFLLKRLGDLLRNEVRKSDISCRFGGEEFLLVMPGVSLEKGYERAERLRKMFSSGMFYHMGVKLNATLSMGVAIYPNHGETWEEVLHTADRIMYAAKAAGKNRVFSA